MVGLDALVRADKHVSGTYTFHVEKSGDGGSRCRSLEKGVGFGALFSFDQRTCAGPSVAAGLRAAETITTRLGDQGRFDPDNIGTSGMEDPLWHRVLSGPLPDLLIWCSRSGLRKSHNGSNGTHNPKWGGAESSP